jgi:phage baseplate assembly protein W
MDNRKITSVWSDIDHRIIADSLGDIKIAINVDSVVTSIDNILRTSFGERVMRPEFGSNLHSMIFENTNSTMMDFLSRQLKDTIERWDNRVAIDELKYFEDPDKNSISIEVSFAIRGYQGIFKHTTNVGGEL